MLGRVFLRGSVAVAVFAGTLAFALGGRNASAQTTPSTPVTQPPPSVSVSNSPNVNESAANPTATFTVTLSAASTTSTVRVDYATLSGTATAGADFLFTQGTLVFQPGQTSKVVTVPVFKDGSAGDAAQEFFYLALSNTRNATVGRSVGQAIIINAPAPPTKVLIDVNDAPQVFEGPKTSLPKSTFKVTLSAPATGVVKVNYKTANSSSQVQAGVDYQATSGTLTFNQGETVKYVYVQVLHDNVPNQPNPKTFFLNLSNPVGNAQIRDGQGVGRIMESK